MAIEKQLLSRIIHKHDIEENWDKATGFIPKQGEIIVYDIDENYNYERFKIGDGNTSIINLPFQKTNINDLKAVSYDMAQELTDAQKAQARVNIGAESSGTAESFAGQAAGYASTAESASRSASNSADDAETAATSAKNAATQAQECLEEVENKLANGELDGYTPVKGTDYWTDTDKTEIVDELTEQTAPVSYNIQTLTDDQKIQARTNIGAMSADTVIPTVPTNVSAFTNDKGYLTAVPSEYVTETELTAKGYLTSYTETDPTVPSWAKASTKPNYTASEVGADASGTASSAVSSHNTSTTAHADIREQINQLSSEKVVLYSEQTLTNEEKAQVRANIGAAEDSMLELVDSIEECTDTSKRYVLPDGYIYAYTYGEHTVESKNHILSSINSDGTPYNGGKGYKEGYRLNSSGTETAYSGATTDTSVVSGFIPYNGETVELRIPTTVFYGGGANYLHLYDSDFNCIKVNADGTVIDGSCRTLQNWCNMNGTNYDPYATYETEATTMRFAWSADAITAIAGVAYIRVSAQVASTSNVAVFDLALGEGIDDTEVIVDYSWQNTGLYYGSADTGNRLDALESTVSDHETRLTTLESGSESSDDTSNDNSTNVPSYWIEHLEEKADAIQTAMEKAGRNKSAFLWYTDAHWVSGNSKVSPLLLNYLYMNTPMNKVNFGGDIIGDTLLATREEMKYLYEWRKAIKDLPNHHSVLGNHDMFSSDTVDYEDDNYRYAFMIASEETPDMVMGDGNYYYIDNPAEKTRYLYFAYIATDHTAMTAQGQFMVDAIKGVPEGWHIVAINHRWWQYSSSSKPTTGALAPFETEMLNVFDAYNARGTTSGTNYFKAQDFTDAKGKVEFCIGGHIHVDYDIESTGGIPIIITTADANQNRVPDSEVDSGTVGTTTEAAVFGIIADYNDTENTKITVVGVGRGTSRVIGSTDTDEVIVPVSISDISYTGDLTVGAVVDKSLFTFTVLYSDGTSNTITGASSVSPETIEIDSDSSVICTITVSYTEGSTTVSGDYVNTANQPSIVNLFDKTDANMLDTGRFNSSKVAVAYQAGQLITGYIDAKVGDTFTVETDKSLKTNGYTGTVQYYDANKTYIGGYNNTNVSANSWKWNSDYLSGEITVDMENTAYVRFCVAYTDMDNIVITKA